MRPRCRTTRVGGGGVEGEADATRECLLTGVGVVSETTGGSEAVLVVGCADCPTGDVVFIKDCIHSKDACATIEVLSDAVDINVGVCSCSEKESRGDVFIRCTAG